MTKFDVWHRVIHEHYLGEIEAEDRDKAEELAYNEITMSRDDYDTSEEFIVEKVVEDEN